MRTQFLLICLMFSVILSCKKEIEQTTLKKVNKTDMNVVVHYKNPVALSSFSADKVKHWKEYYTLIEFINRFEKISPNEALSNALELKKLSKKIKDSIRVKALENAAFKARLNVFENEVLRLADMTYISAITSKEVNNQVEKTLLLLSSINAKINTVFDQIRFDEDVDLNTFFKLDSSKASDTVKNPLKKSIKKLD